MKAGISRQYCNCLNGRQGRQIDLPYSITAKRMYEGVLLAKDDKKVISVHQKEKRKKESDSVLCLQIPGETQIPGTNLKICCTISGENEKNSRNALIMI